MKRNGFMGALLLACLACAPALAQTAGTPVNVTLGDITDSRTTGQFFKELKVEFKLGGDAVFDAFSIGTPVFTTAKDDTGRSLLKDDKTESLLWTMQPRQKKADTETATAELVNPARKASTVTLEGTIPVYSPSRDPAAIVTLQKVSAYFGKPIAIKGGGSLTFKGKEKDKNPISGAMFGMGGGNGVEFQLSDPKGQLVRMEFLSADGKVIEIVGRSRFTINGVDSYSYSFKEPLPEDASLKVYFATPKSMLNVPFKFDSVALP
jgi:hypothetical protein